MTSQADKDVKKDSDKEEEGAPAENHTKSFLGHMYDLRTTIVWSAAALAVGMIIAIPLAPYVRELLKYPMDMANLNPRPTLEVLDVMGGITMAMRIIFWTGLIISIPGIIFAIGNFVLPGLTDRERRAIRNSSGFAVVLFIAGVCTGYFMTLPVALEFMMSVNNWMGTSCKIWKEPEYVAFVMRLLVVFGLAFELPVVVLALGSVGIVTSKQLRNKRRHVIVGLMVMSMLLTPADPYTMLLMAVPMTGLFELCIWLIWAKEKRKKAEED